MHKEDQKLIAYCGLYCGDCHGYKGRVPNLARDLRKELRDTKYDKFAKGISRYDFGKILKKYNDCYQVLGAMVKFRCNLGCRQGGGPPFCKIRKCCQKAGIQGCWECDELETCDKLDFLKGVHGDGHIKNLKKIRKKGVKEFQKGKRYW